jgi:hypothetical protein
LLIDFIISLKDPGSSLLIIIEDMRPYNMRVTDNVINTIKFIGQLEWRLRELHIDFVLFPRWEIKSWVYSSNTEMCNVEIKKKIEYAASRKEKIVGRPIDRRKPSFVYVDDRIVEKAIKLWWKIEKPKVGQPCPFGLQTHAWQGLSLATFYIERHDPSFLQTTAIS